MSRHFGILVPSTNTTCEIEYCRLAPKLQVHTGRLGKETTGEVPVREQRRLAAILAADVVGYSRLMGRGESGTLARLRENRSEHPNPVLTKYGGRLIKLTNRSPMNVYGRRLGLLGRVSMTARYRADRRRAEHRHRALLPVSRRRHALIAAVKTA
jgi:class 3 adenylate cyclase